MTDLFLCDGRSFRVPAGWLPLLQGLQRSLTERGGSITDVRLKFENLRVSYTGPSECGELVRIAEATALHTCEVCGEHGRVSHKDEGSWSVYCEKHLPEGFSFEGENT